MRRHKTYLLFVINPAAAKLTIINVNPFQTGLLGRLLVVGCLGIQKPVGLRELVILFKTK